MGVPKIYSRTELCNACSKLGLIQQYLQHAYIGTWHWESRKQTTELEDECTSETYFKPFLSKCEQISPFARALCLWVDDVELWARHHQRWTVLALLWTKHIEYRIFGAEEVYLEVNYTFGVASILLPTLCPIANNLVWLNAHNLRKHNKFEKIFHLHALGFNDASIPSHQWTDYWQPSEMIVIIDNLKEHCKLIGPDGLEK